MENGIKVSVSGFVAHHPIRANHKLALMSVGVHISARETQYIKALVFGEQSDRAMNLPKGMRVKLRGELEFASRRKRNGKGMKAALTVRTFRVEECDRLEPQHLRATVCGVIEADAQYGRTAGGAETSRFELLVARRRGKRFDKTRVSAFAEGKLGAACNANLYRGRQAEVAGDLRLKRWTDRNGLEQAALAVTVGKLKFTGRRRAGRPKYSAAA